MNNSMNNENLELVLHSQPLATSVDDGGQLPTPEMIEMLKNLAAYKEKQFKWEQSAQKLSLVSKSDPNKSELLDIIDFVENHKSTSREKAIYLYEQLGRKCQQHKNYIGAAKAFERAASLRIDISERNEIDQILCSENKDEIVSNTIQCLESAILNYDAIHKYKHAGTLHYRCSKILSLVDAPRKHLEQHHVRALEYFTKPDHELKQRKRINGQKISCYSSYNTCALTKLGADMEHFTTTTTTTNTIKFHAEQSDSDDSVSNSSPPRASNSKNLPYDFADIRQSSYSPVEDLFKNCYNPMDESGGGYPNRSSQSETSTPPPVVEMAEERFNRRQQHHYEHHNSSKERRLTKMARHMSASSSSLIYHGPKQSKLVNQSSAIVAGYRRDSLGLGKTSYRRVEDRIESARKLVKKLQKMCPFYKVGTNGIDAGRVYCSICDRYLGAVSSTLKNHVNTQEHRQAYEDSQQQQQQPQTSAVVSQYPIVSSQTMTTTNQSMTGYSLNNNTGQQSELNQLNQLVPYSQPMLYQSSLTTGQVEQMKPKPAYPDSGELLLDQPGTWSSNSSTNGQYDELNSQYTTYSTINNQTNQNPISNLLPNGFPLGTTVDTLSNNNKIYQNGNNTGQLQTIY